MRLPCSYIPMALGPTYSSFASCCCVIPALVLRYVICSASISVTPFFRQDNTGFAQSMMNAVERYVKKEESCSPTKKPSWDLVPQLGFSMLFSRQTGLPFQRESRNSGCRHRRLFLPKCTHRPCNNGQSFRYTGHNHHDSNY